MSRIFVSYSSKDRAMAAALSAWLTEEGWGDHFIDFDPVRGLPAAQRWKESLLNAAGGCEAVIFCISESWLESEWCRAEWHWAEARGKPLIPIVVGPVGNLPDWLREWQMASLVPTGMVHAETVRIGDVAFARRGITWLRNGLERCRLQAESFKFPLGRTPFRGLQALQEDDAAVFFGREARLGDALDTLRRLRESGAPKVLIVLGASGSGKSSFVRAGLFPRLRRDPSFVCVRPIRPSTGVIGSDDGLAAVLTELSVASGGSLTRSQVASSLMMGLDSAWNLLGELLGEVAACPDTETQKRTLVICIDQAEELLASDGEAAREAERVLSLLKHASSPERADVLFVLTIRSDLYSKLQRVEALLDVPIELFDLSPLPPTSLRDVIEKPLKVYAAAGGKLAIDHDLVDRLVSEARGADALPLLAFILERLFKERAGAGRLTLNNYAALGGITGAIEQAVGAALERVRRLSGREASNRIVRRAFVPALAGWEPTLETAFRKEASAIKLPPEALIVLDAMVEERLIVKSAGADGPTYDIAHEALLREWPKLKHWIDEERDLLAARDLLKRAAAEWSEAAEHIKDSRLVHAGDRLTLAEELCDPAMREDYSAEFGDIERDYLRACRTRETKVRRTSALSFLTSARLALLEGDLGRSLRYVASGVAAANDIDGSVAPELLALSEAIASRNLVSSCEPITGRVAAIAFAAPNRLAYACSGESRIVVSERWKVGCKKAIEIAAGREVEALRFSENGSHLLIAASSHLGILTWPDGADGAWESEWETRVASTRIPNNLLEKARFAISYVQVSNDGAHAMVGLDQGMLVWSVGHEPVVMKWKYAVFAPDGVYELQTARVVRWRSIEGGWTPDAQWPLRPGESAVAVEVHDKEVVVHLRNGKQSYSRRAAEWRGRVLTPYRTTQAAGSMVEHGICRNVWRALPDKLGNLPEVGPYRPAIAVPRSSAQRERRYGADLTPTYFDAEKVSVGSLFSNEKGSALVTSDGAFLLRWTGEVSVHCLDGVCEDAFWEAPSEARIVSRVGQRPVVLQQTAMAFTYWDPSARKIVARMRPELLSVFLREQRRSIVNEREIIIGSEGVVLRALGRGTVLFRSVGSLCSTSRMLDDSVERIALANRSGRIRIVELRSGRVLAERAFPQQIHSIAAGEHGLTFVASAGIYVCDWNLSEPVCRYDLTETDEVEVFAHGRGWLFNDDGVRILLDGEVLHHFPRGGFHSRSPSGNVVLFHDGRKFLVCSHSAVGAPSLQETDGAVDDFQWSDDENWLTAISRDHGIMVWHVPSGRLVKVISIAPSRFGDVVRLGISSVDRQVWALYSDGVFRAWTFDLGIERGHSNLWRLSAELEGEGEWRQWDRDDPVVSYASETTEAALADLGDGEWNRVRSERDRALRRASLYPGKVRQLLDSHWNEHARRLELQNGIAHRLPRSLRMLMDGIAWALFIPTTIAVGYAVLYLLGVTPGLP